MAIIYDFKAIRERCDAISSSIMGKKKGKSWATLKDATPLQCLTCDGTGRLISPTGTYNVCRSCSGNGYL